MVDAPLIPLGDLTKPATVLVEKISDAVGGLFKPYQIVRVAKAEAEADRIRAESDIAVTELHRRAMHRFLEEEAQKQSNMEEITKKALPLLEENSSPENVEDDWITNFFDKSRIVSDDDMQRLWSKVLAGEANAPGTFSKKTVNLMADLEKSDAELFTRLCGFVWIIATPSLLIFDNTDIFYNEHGINFESLSHLESLGLIHFDSVSGYLRKGFPKKISVYYYGKPLELTLPKDIDNIMQIGEVRFTQSGMQLLSVCGSKPVDGFFDFVYDKWAAERLVPKKESEQETTTEGELGK